MSQIIDFDKKKKEAELAKKIKPEDDIGNFKLQQMHNGEVREITFNQLLEQQYPMFKEVAKEEVGELEGDKGYKGIYINQVRELFDAYSAGDIVKIKSLITSGTDINTGDAHDRTLLHRAAETNNEELARFLLSNGADINDLDVAGWTPIHRAVFKGNNQLIRILHENGADINIPDYENKTALAYAEDYGYKETEKLLISLGATK